jgi:hypothetical protein
MVEAAREDIAALRRASPPPDTPGTPKGKGLSSRPGKPYRQRGRR